MLQSLWRGMVQNLIKLNMHLSIAQFLEIYFEETSIQM